MNILTFRYLARYFKLIINGVLQKNKSLIVPAINGLYAGIIDLFINFIIPSKKCTCNICGWEGERFIPSAGSGYFLRHYICPQCGETGRYRMLYTLISPLLSSDKKCLEIGPNRSFAKIISERFSIDYLCCDIQDKRANLIANLTAMPIKDNSFDIILCMHVIEHIDDDKSAMFELNRILKTSGKLYVQVPTSNQYETLEYGYPNPADNAHYRLYGMDIKEKLSDAGFTIESILAQELFNEEDIEKFGFRDESNPVFICSKP